MDNIPIQPLTKKIVSGILGISTITFARIMKNNEEEILKLYPYYKTTDKAIPGSVVVLIGSKLGYSPLEIAYKLRAYFSKIDSTDVKDWIDIYGLWKS